MDERLNVAILDDDQFCIDQLRQLLEQFSYVHVTGEAVNGQAYAELLRSAPVDLVFLDIKIQDENGFSVAEYTKRVYPGVMIVFTTAFDDFAIQGYAYEALDFLAKPVSPIRLEKALTRAVEKKRRIVPAVNSRIGIQMSGGFRFVEVGSILFVESVGRKVQMVCRAGGEYQKHELHESMSTLEKMFDAYDFMRVHQSFLVPLRRISGMSGTDIGSGYELRLEEWPKPIPVSRSKYKELRGRLAELGIRFI